MEICVQLKGNKELLFYSFVSHTFSENISNGTNRTSMTVNISSQPRLICILAPLICGSEIKCILKFQNKHYANWAMCDLIPLPRNSTLKMDAP